MVSRRAWRFDLGCPLHVAHEVHQAWPGSKLVVIDDAGHTGSATMAARLREEVDALAFR